MYDKGNACRFRNFSCSEMTKLFAERPHTGAKLKPAVDLTLQPFK